MYIATLFSKLFEPALLLAIAFVACAVRLGLPFWSSVMWLILLMGPMIVYRLWAKKSKGLDWDIYERRDRIKPFLHLLGFLGVVGAILWIAEPRLLPLFSLCFAWTLGFFIITVLWTKISGHVGGDMLAQEASFVIPNHSPVL